MAEGIPGASTVSNPVAVCKSIFSSLHSDFYKMVKITDKVQIRGGADFTFVCSKIPFAVSCSTDLPHQEHNLIDLDLVNKMKINLKNIKVARLSLMGRSVRAVGFVNQTVQCVHQGKISGTINLQAKVVRNLYDMFDVDCIASAKTYERLVGRKPPPAPDDQMDTEEEDNNDEREAAEHDEKDDISAEAEHDEEDDISAEAEHNKKNVIESMTRDDANIETNATEKGGKIKYDEEYLNYISSLPIYQPPQMTLREWRKIPKFGTIKNVSTYETSPGECVDSSCEDDQTDDNHDEDADNVDDCYQASNHREPEPGKTFCQFCFVSGQPIRVTNSHNVLDVTCPSMSHVDKERIHGPNWIAKMNGYND